MKGYRIIIAAALMLLPLSLGQLAGIITYYAPGIQIQTK